MTIVAICSVIALPIVWINTLRMFFAKRRNHSGKTRKLSKAKLKLKNKPKQINKLPPFNHPDRQGKYKLKGLKQKKVNILARHDFVPLYQNGKYVAGVTYTHNIGKNRLPIANNQYIGTELHYKQGNMRYTDKNLSDYKRFPNKYNEDELLKRLKEEKNNLNRYKNFIKK